MHPRCSRFGVQHQSFAVCLQSECHVHRLRYKSWLRDKNERRHLTVAMLGMMVSAALARVEGAEGACDRKACAAHEIPCNPSSRPRRVVAYQISLAVMLSSPAEKSEVSCGGEVSQAARP